MRRVFGISVFGAVLSAVTAVVLALVLWMQFTQRTEYTENTWIFLAFTVLICLAVLLYVLFGVCHAHIVVRLSSGGIIAGREKTIPWESVVLNVQRDHRGKRSICIMRAAPSDAKTIKARPIALGYSKNKLRVLLTYMLAFQDGTVRQRVFSEAQWRQIEADAVALRQKHHK